MAAVGSSEPAAVAARVQVWAGNVEQPRPPAAGFAEAACGAVTTIEGRWPEASAVVLWSAPGRFQAVSSQVVRDLQPVDLSDEREILHAMARVPNARKPHREPATDAIVLPITVGGEQQAALCVVGAGALADGRDRALLEGFVSLLSTVCRCDLDRQRLLREVDALRRETRTDPLTQLLNRRGFLVELDHHCEHSTDPQTGDILLLADIRGLKEANDRHGHTLGDQLLLDVAEALRATAAPGDVLGRFGGDEFAVIVCKDSPAVRARTYAGDVQAYLDQRCGERPTSLTVAFGGQSLAGVATAREALARADDAMYHRLA
jgi:diguanylate cyclase (GGDEF)-like protein